MRIGIDIDNVISNFNERLLEEYLKHDKELNNTGIVNENAGNIRYMFDWSEVEERNFYKENIERIAISLAPIEGAKEIIDKLREDGNHIYIISGRDNGEYSNPFKMTEDWLNKYEIKYNKLILTNAYDKHQKTIECIKNEVDIMIEDSTSICVDLKNNGIRVLKMSTKFNQDTNEFEMVYNWNEIYNVISQQYKNNTYEKPSVILDTDTYNETDDQFALAYLLKMQNKFNIEAITIAPFQNRWHESTDSGIERSYEEAKKVCNLCGINKEDFIYKGSTDYIINGYNKRNEAVNKIIEIALKNDKTYILGIAAITNIALAIKYEPKIIDRIEIIWLGGHTLLNKDNLHEANFIDVDAIKMVFESKVKLTIIPCRGVASNLITTTDELEKHLKGKSDLCDFLYNRFEEVVNKRALLPRAPLWDLAVIAYLRNKKWFQAMEVSCPDINEDTSYKLTESNHKITMINYMEVNKIYNDLFEILKR